jgi:hypothetical protein
MDMDMDMGSMRINNDILTSRQWLFFKIFREMPSLEFMALQLYL